MELPRRGRGDERLQPGELTDLMARLRRVAPEHDLTSVICYAFDHRTRMLPFIFADMRMAPAGVRAIGSAMLASGFDKTRIVLQTWNKRFRPSEMRLDGRIPDIFMVSSMQIHSHCCKELIRDCCRIPAEQRPLIIAGGPKTIYEPWDVFAADASGAWGADVAVTGEEFVLLSLLERVLAARGAGESVRSAFARVRDAGDLDDIPGLVYPRVEDGTRGGRVAELVDTGMQRLLGDLDELPHPLLGYKILESPSAWRTTLNARPLDGRKVRRTTPIASLALTFGCKFACPYCPIPAYNQRQHRLKSPDRIVDEIRRLRKEYGIKYYFGADDNFFNDHARTRAIVEAMARAEIDGRPFARSVEWGTEVTVHDTLAMKDDLPTVRKAGCRMLWMGIEDITATFVKKGQSVARTEEALRALRAAHIAPMPMMMLHDGQPFYTPGKPYGLLNQTRLLWKWGAPSLQVLMMTPATGSKLYEQPYGDGIVIDSAAGRPVETHMLDGNYVVATAAPHPARKQLSILGAYIYFYNPIRLLRALLVPRRGGHDIDLGMQLIGMYGVVHTVRRTLGWALRLLTGKIRFGRKLPASPWPMRDPKGDRGSHDLPIDRVVPLTVRAERVAV
ncbi:MAG: radical SAM protein [Phycisphaerae bacterium]